MKRQKDHVGIVVVVVCLFVYLFVYVFVCLSLCLFVVYELNSHLCTLGKR